MEKFKHVKPNKEYKEKAIEYITELNTYNSDINGAGGLSKYLNNYEEWLNKLENDEKIKNDAFDVPTETFFLVRENDDRIIGMMNIRLKLNDELERYGGHIGYSIRPSERRKGYNKINLYLGLKHCKECGLNEIKLHCDKNNKGSKKTMIALGGKKNKEFFNESENIIAQEYIFDVSKNLEETSLMYDNRIAN